MPASRSFPFLSPLTKLLAFFQRSRDKWKEKSKAAKRQNKSLKLCLAKMKESRDRWKARALEAEMAGAKGDPSRKVQKELPPPRAGTRPRGICPR